MRLPAGHPEGYLEAMANLYGDFARAIRERVEGPDVPGVPGIEIGLRGMAFIEAAIINHRGEAKWTTLKTGASQL
jgi:predicted dehydrogenase